MEIIAELAQQAAHEIKHLRQRNQILEAQMEVVRIFGRATAAVHHDGGGMQVDVAWQIEEELKRIKASEDIARDVAMAS